MEKYITKINDKLLKKNDLEHAKKVKMRYRAIGGTVLAVGLAGFISAMIAFAVYFVNAETESAFVAWQIAIPFVLVFVAGSVVTRIGDQLLKGINLSESKQGLVDKELTDIRSEIQNEKTDVVPTEEREGKATKKQTAKKKD